MDVLFEKLKAESPVNSLIKGTSKKLEGVADISLTTETEIKKKINNTAIHKTPTIKIPEKSKDKSNTVLEVAEFTIQTPNLSEVEDSPKKQTPTKAQQKLFEPPTLEKNKEKPFSKFKTCKVRIRRDDLQKLIEIGLNKSNTAMNKDENEKEKQKEDAVASKTGTKRKASTGNSPPAKKGRLSNNTSVKTSTPVKKYKQNSSFFIKITKESPSLKKLTANNQHSKAVFLTPKEKIQRKRATQNSTTNAKGTKYTRSDLVSQFGKRYFKSFVKVERCRHPMMLTFESNERARKLQIRNKSKNLSVSFKEQVEIFGLSDSESNDSITDSEEHFVPITPARLKKVEHGKVVEDIEIDASLFADIKEGNNSSTPLRKKVEKKSFSPLKDDSSPSARSELLKLANEKLPPSALRRLVTEEEDDDEECEYIVPIDLPERRSSRTSSISTILSGDVPTTVDKAIEVEKKDEQINEEKINDISCEVDNPLPLDTSLNVEKFYDDDVLKDEEKQNTKTTNGNSTVDEADDVITNDNEFNVKNQTNVSPNTLDMENKTNESFDALLDENETNLKNALLNDFPRLQMEVDSECLTPNPSFTSDAHGTPDQLITNTMDELSNDIKEDEGIEKLITTPNIIEEDTDIIDVQTSLNVV